MVILSTQKAEVEIAGVERRYNQMKPLKWLFLFCRLLSSYARYVIMRIPLKAHLHLQAPTSITRLEIMISNRIIGFCEKCCRLRSFLESTHQGVVVNRHSPHRRQNIENIQLILDMKNNTLACLNAAFHL